MRWPAILVFAACSGGSSTVQNRVPPDPPAPDLSCVPFVDGHDLSFILTNPTGVPRTVHYYQPFMGIELTVTDRSGNKRSITQPPINMPVAAAELVVPARSRALLRTPIRLRFSTDTWNSTSPFTWVISGARTLVTLDVKLRLDGEKTVLTCRATM